MNTLLVFVGVFIGLLAILFLCERFYQLGVARGLQEIRDFEEAIKDCIPKPEIEGGGPLELMVPQSLVNQMLEDAKSAHNLALERVAGEIRLEAKEWKKNEEKRIRADAIKRHKNVTKGKTTEHLVPYMDDFDFDPSDCRFMGSPIDIIVFDGLSNGEDVSIVFLEVKTGKSASLSTRERKVRDAIKDGRVEWRLIKKNPKS